MLTYTSGTSLTTNGSSWGAVLFTLIAMVVVLVLAYYTTRWLGSRMNVHSQTNIIKVVDKVAIGQDKLLAIVEIGDKIMLVGMSGNSITKLCDIEDSDLVSQKSPKNDEKIFHQAFKSALKSNFGTKDFKKNNDNI